MSETTQPRLEITGPDGHTSASAVGEQGIRIGRSAEVVDLALSPDPQRLVSKLHCLIEPHEQMWHLIDNGSTNGTFVRRQNRVERVRGMMPLTDGDTVLILGELSEQSAPRFWELTFRDPNAARNAKTTEASWHPEQWLVTAAAPAVCLEYDWAQARLYRTSGGVRTEITGLRLQEQHLIRYMAERNRTNGNVPVLCTYEELIHAVWGEESYHDQSDINHLVWELRKKLDSGQTPTLLETVRKSGCRLHTCPQH